jgi:hypothetical protein
MRGSLVKDPSRSEDLAVMKESMDADLETHFREMAAMIRRYAIALGHEIE